LFEGKVVRSGLSHFESKLAKSCRLPRFAPFRLFPSVSAFGLHLQIPKQRRLPAHTYTLCPRQTRRTSARDMQCFESTRIAEASLPLSALSHVDCFGRHDDRVTTTRFFPPFHHGFLVLYQYQCSPLINHDQKSISFPAAWIGFM
jgi:hypothetical protein